MLDLLLKLVARRAAAHPRGVHIAAAGTSIISTLQGGWHPLPSLSDSSGGPVYRARYSVKSKDSCTTSVGESCCLRTGALRR